ncbi:MAG: heme-binding beta-barrel domain-containing protein [Acidimicrobiales bacterium]|jgi:hypothetical protein
MITAEQFGPLAHLVGTWEGNRGHDDSYSHDKSSANQNSYFERMTLSPFGPVDNGAQSLFGLDYRIAAWKDGEDDPFHTEAGYWLWDASRSEVMRCCVVPRGVAINAIGSADSGSVTYRMTATRGSNTDGILSNAYLEQAARSTTYRIDIDLSVDGVLARAVLCRSRARAVSAQRLHRCAVPPWHVGSRR